MRRAMAAMALATLVSGCDYNRIVALREQIDAAWAQVENQLQRRNDLIPNLIEVTRGYAAHEKEIFVHVADARAKLMSAGSRDEKIDPAGEPGNAPGRLPERDARGTRKPRQTGATGWHGPSLRRHEHRPANRWKPLGRLPMRLLLRSGRRHRRARLAPLRGARGRAADDRRRLRRGRGRMRRRLPAEPPARLTP